MPEIAAIIGVDADFSKVIQKANTLSGQIKPLVLRLDDNRFTGPLGSIRGGLQQFNKALDASNARVISFGASAGILYSFVRAFTSIARSTIDVHKSLAEIGVVLNTSTEGLNKFGNSLFDIAKNTGQSFKIVSQAALELSRQGLSVEETLKRTRDALILTRFTNLDAASSVEALTTAINSFDKAALTSTQIVNKLFNVDTQFAVSSRDLAEALSRVGSTAQDAGVGIDSLIGLVTSAKQITGRDGPVIGNSLKTIFQRLQRPEVLSQLEKLGVLTKDVAGNLLPVDQILISLARTYDTLAQSQQNQVTQLAAGVFQANIFKALLNDLAKANSVYTGATNASTNATNQAIQRNQELNKTLSALVNESFANLTKAGASIGKDVFEPFARRGLSIINALTSGFNFSEPEGFGEKIGSGILKGIGSFLAGPGAIAILGILGRLTFKFTKDIARDIGDLTGLNRVSQERANIEKLINGTISNQPALIERIKAGQLSVLDAERAVLNILNQELVLRERLASISTVVAKSAIAQNILRSSKNEIIARIPTQTIPSQGTIPPRKVAEGFIPNFAKPRIPGINVSRGGSEPIFDFIDVNNNAKNRYIDYLIRVKGMNETAAIKESKKVYGNYGDIGRGRNLESNYPILNKGFIPNFAGIKVPSIQTSGGLSMQSRPILDIKEGAHSFDSQSYRKFLMDVKGLSSKDTDKYIHKLLSERMIFSDGLIPNFVPIVKAAALQYKGQIFTGPIHAIAYEKLLQKHPEAKLIPSETLKSGFLVKKSKYLHEEFLSRSDTAKLIGQDHSFLQAEDLNLNSGFIPNFNYSSFIKELKTKRFPNVYYDIGKTKSGKRAYLNYLEAKKRGKGYGTNFMLELTKLADKHRIGMELFPQAQKMRGALGQEDLEYFYSNFGFDLTSDFLGDPYMTRKPTRKKLSNLSSGFIPKESSILEKIGAYEGGYTPGNVKTTNIKGLGKVIYNDAEKIKTFPGLEQPAIIPPQQSRAGINYKKEFKNKHGFNPYMNEGLVPNYIWKNIAFRGERKGVTPVDEGIFGKGTYYTTDINYAAQYGKTHKAQIEFKNPFITENAYEVEKLGHDAFTFSRKSGQSYEEANEAASKAIRKKLENDGYDGIVLKQPAGQAEIVVFYPDKSVIKLLPPPRKFSSGFSPNKNKGLIPNYVLTPFEGKDYQKKFNMVQGDYGPFHIKGHRDLISPNRFFVNWLEKKEKGNKTFEYYLPQFIEDLKKEGMNKIEYIADYSDTRLKARKRLFLRLRKKYSFSEGLIPNFASNLHGLKLGINKHGFDPYKSEGFIPNLAKLNLVPPANKEKGYNFFNLEEKRGKNTSSRLSFGKSDFSKSFDISYISSAQKGDARKLFEQLSSFAKKRKYDIKSSVLSPQKKSDKFEISNINDLYSIYPQIRYRKGLGTTSLDIAKFDPILKLTRRLSFSTIENFENAIASKKLKLTELDQIEGLITKFSSGFSLYENKGLIPNFNKIFATQGKGLYDKFNKNLLPTVEKAESEILKSNLYIPEFPIPTVFGGYRKQLKGYYHGINRFIGKGYSKPSIELFRDADYLDTYVPKHEYGHFISQLAGFSKGKRNLGEFFGQMGINKLPNDELFADIYSRLVENPIYNVGKNSQYADEILSFIQKFKSGTFGSVDELIEKSKINLNKNKGLIPNFNALSQAISRENSAGIQMSQIRVGQSSNLKSNLNPLGLGVFNTRDEPLGLNQGINRTKSMGLDPKRAGVYNKGLVPSFAPPKFITDPATFKPFTPIEKRQELGKVIDEFKSSIKKGKIAFDQVAPKVGELSSSFNLTTKGSNRLLQSFNQTYRNFETQQFSELKSKAGGVFFSNKKFERAIEGRKYTPEQQAELSNLRNQRSQSIQNRALITSFVAPMIGETLAQFIGTGTKTQRGFGATASGLGNIASFAALGASFGGLPGLAIGGTLGLLTSLPKIFEGFTDIIPDLTKEFDRLKGSFTEISNSTSSYIQISERLKEIQQGNIKATVGQVALLKGGQKQELAKIFATDRNFGRSIFGAVSQGNLGNAQVLQIQFEQLLQQNLQAKEGEIKVQDLIKRRKLTEEDKDRVLGQRIESRGGGVGGGFGLVTVPILAKKSTEESVPIISNLINQLLGARGTPKEGQLQGKSLIDFLTENIGKPGGFDITNLQTGGAKDIRDFFNNTLKEINAPEIFRKSFQNIFNTLDISQLEEFAKAFDSNQLKLLAESIGLFEAANIKARKVADDFTQKLFESAVELESFNKTLQNSVKSTIQSFNAFIDRQKTAAAGFIDFQENFASPEVIAALKNLAANRQIQNERTLGTRTAGLKLGADITQSFSKIFSTFQEKAFKEATEKQRSVGIGSQISVSNTSKEAFDFAAPFRQKIEKILNIQNIDEVNNALFELTDSVRKQKQITDADLEKDRSNDILRIKSEFLGEVFKELSSAGLDLIDSKRQETQAEIEKTNTQKQIFNQLRDQISIQRQISFGGGIENLLGESFEKDLLNAVSFKNRGLQTGNTFLAAQGALQLGDILSSLQITDVGDELRAVIVKGTAERIRTALRLTGSQSNISPEQLARTQVENRFKTAKNQEKLLTDLSNLIPPIQDSANTSNKVNANLLAFTGKFDNFISLAQGAGIRTIVTNIEDLKQGIKVENKEIKPDLTPFPMMDIPTSPFSDRISNAWNIRHIVPDNKPFPMMGRIENPQFDNTTFPMMERFDKEINEQLENKLERLKNISELTSVNFKKEFGIKFDPNALPYTPINRKTQDLIITKKEEISEERIRKSAGIQLDNKFITDLTTAKTTLDTMVSSTTSFHDEMMQVNDIINELNIRLGKFSEVNFRKGGDEFRKLTKKDLFKDTVNESNRVNDSLTESLRKLNAMHAAGTGFTEDMEKLVNEINDINIQLGNFDKVDIKEAFFGPLRYGAKEFARDFKDEIKSVGTDFKSGLSGALKDLVRGKGSIGEVFRGAALDFLYKRLDFGIDQTVNQLGNLFAGLFKGKSGGTNVNQGDNTGATVVSTIGNVIAAFFGSKGKYEGGIIKRYSQGGLVTGGSGTKDDVPALLTEGEYVISKAAIERIKGSDTKYRQEQKENRLRFIKYSEVANKPLPSLVREFSTSTSSGINALFRNAFVYNDPRRPTSAAMQYDKRLSEFALMDENNPQNINRLRREETFYSYIKELNDYIRSVKRARQHAQSLKETALYTSVISAVVGAGLGALAKKGGTGTGSAGEPTGPGGSYYHPPKDIGRYYYGGLIKNYAMGGRIFGGQSPTDNIPTMLTGGEYVVKKDIVRKFGKDYFDRINYGTKKGYAEGGLVGSDIGVGVNTENISNYILKLIDITTSLRETINKNLQGTAVNNGQTNRLNPQTNAGNEKGITVNSFITINIDKNGNVSSDIDNKTNQQNNNQEDIRKNRELTKLIEAQSTQTIIDNLRPGGLLYSNRERS